MRSQQFTKLKRKSFLKKRFRVYAESEIKKRIKDNTEPTDRSDTFVTSQILDRKYRSSSTLEQ